MPVKARTIPYNPRQVALIVQTAAHFTPAFGSRVWESPQRVAAMASGELPPSDSVIEFFNLQKVRGSYQWSVS